MGSLPAVPRSSYSARESRVPLPLHVWAVYVRMCGESREACLAWRIERTRAECYIIHFMSIWWYPLEGKATLMISKSADGPMTSMVVLRSTAWEGQRQSNVLEIKIPPPCPTSRMFTPSSTRFNSRTNGGVTATAVGCSQAPHLKRLFADEAHPKRFCGGEQSHQVRLISVTPTGARNGQIRHR